MNLSQATATLEFFNEKADKLAGLSFTNHLRTTNLTVSVEYHDGGLFLTDSAPPDEAIDAFVLTLRFFVQDNERISINRIGLLYESLDVDEQIKRLFREGRQSINKRLDSPSMFLVNDESLTHREIFDVFLYGGLAHGNDVKRARFREWQAGREIFALLRILFLSILGDLLEFIFWLRGFNAATLKILAG